MMMFLMKSLMKFHLFTKRLAFFTLVKNCKMIKIALLCAPNIIHSNITVLVPKLYNTDYFLIDKTSTSWAGQHHF